MAFARIVQSWFQAWSRNRSSPVGQEPFRQPDADTTGSQPNLRCSLADLPPPRRWAPSLMADLGRTPEYPASGHPMRLDEPSRTIGVPPTVVPHTPDSRPATRAPAIATDRKAANDPCVRGTHPIKIRYARGHRGGARLAISGRLADVCAELDRLAQLEQRGEIVESAA